MNENMTEIESNIDGVEVTIKGPTDKASEIFGRLSQANKSTVESIHAAVSNPAIIDLISSVEDKDTLIEKALPLVEKFDPRIGSLLSIFKVFSKKKERSEPVKGILVESVNQTIEAQLNNKITSGAVEIPIDDRELLRLLDFKEHRFFNRFGGIEPLIDAPITITDIGWNKGGLTFSAGKSVFRNYAFDSNFEFIAQEPSSHNVSTPLRRAVEEKDEKAKYILVVDVGNEKGDKVLGRSLVTEV